MLGCTWHEWDNYFGRKRSSGKFIKQSRIGSKFPDERLPKAKILGSADEQTARFFRIILLLFCSHRRFILNNLAGGEAQRSLFDIINSVAMCLAEFI